MDVNAFKVPTPEHADYGTKRRYITHTGILPEIDKPATTDEEIEQYVDKFYTMCDNTRVKSEASSEVVDQPTNEKAEEQVKEPVTDPVKEEPAKEPAEEEVVESPKETPEESTISTEE